jgi:hypothetical protein
MDKLEESAEDTDSWTSHTNLTKNKIFLKPVSRGSGKNYTEYICISSEQVS